MNAHVRNADLVAGAHGCPVEAIGRQLAAILAEGVRLEDQAAAARKGGGDLDSFGRGRTRLELVDLSDALTQRVGWLTPTSPAGAVLTALLMAQAGREADGDDEWQRRQTRLSERLMEYLTAQAGRSIEDLGLSQIYLNAEVERDVRDRFAR